MLLRTQNNSHQLIGPLAEIILCVVAALLVSVVLLLVVLCLVLIRVKQHHVNLILPVLEQKNQHGPTLITNFLKKNAQHQGFTVTGSSVCTIKKLFLKLVAHFFYGLHARMIHLAT